MKTSKLVLFISFVISISILSIIYCCPSANADPSVPEPPSEEVVPVERSFPEIYIEVNIAATEMTVYENGNTKFVKPVAIGQGVYPTPEQESLIQKIEWNPWWYPPPSDWAKDDVPTPPGPGNPLGVVKMPLSEAILFHGTNKASSIGRAASHGCMRMHNADAEEVAWYLQSTLSSKTDESFREKYKKSKRTTFVVNLDVPVQVRLIYKPVIAKNGFVVFYKDYYRKLGNKKKAAIMAELVRGGALQENIDEFKVEELAKNWPESGTQIPVESLLIKYSEAK